MTETFSELLNRIAIDHLVKSYILQLENVAKLARIAVNTFPETPEVLELKKALDQVESL
ncbi:MAG: hypothetical protein ACLFQP_03555 [Halothece sp.]